MSTDPEFLWLGEKHKEALAVLKYAIMENKGVLALTGDVGTGKTTLINALLKSLGKDTITATIYDARLDVLDFFNTVAAAFKIEGTFQGKGKFILRFMDFLIKAHERQQKVLLIIDEAQGINADLLEEIRLLSNLEAEYTRLLNIFFVGQNEFVDILQKYENRALRQRVTIRYHIDPLTLNETAAYIGHRLEVSGTTAPIFDSGAIDEIYFFSGGYPRLINIMCDHALLTGYVREVRMINANHIRECREELLVSKKTSEKDFGFPAGNQPVISREPMASGSPREPMAADSPREFVASSPSREPVASDLSEEIMDYVKDSPLPEDDRDSFGPRYPMHKPATPRKIQKKRFFTLRSLMIFLLVAGAGAGYYFYAIHYSKTKSFVTRAQTPPKKYFSLNTKLKNGNPATNQARPETSDLSKQIQSEKQKVSHSPITDTSDSGISKTPVPSETESFQPDTSKTFSQATEAASFSNKSEAEPVGKTPAMKTDNSGSLNAIPKGPLDADSSKKAQSITTNGSGTARPELTSKPKANTLTSKKSLEKIQASVQTPAKTPPKSSAVADGHKDLSSKTPVGIPTPKLKKENVRMAASDPDQIRITPKNTKSVKKEAVNKAVEKPETSASVARSALEVNKTKEPDNGIRETPKKKPAVSSSNSSEKQTNALFEKFKKSLSKEPAVSVTRRPSKPLKTIKEKTPAPVSASVQEKPRDQKVSDRAKQETGEKIASLGIEANKSEKTKKAHLTYIPLMTRLKSFLKKYCRTYEQKDLNKFSDFFAFNAVEKGKPFKSWLPTYRRNFSRIDSIEYNIDLLRYATREDTGLVKIDGTFHIRARLEGHKEWLKSSGDISMILEADGNSFKVKELDY